MKLQRYLPYIWTWPVDVLLWLVWILPFWALWGEKLRWEEGSFVFNLQEDSWPSRTWYSRWGGTSIGHAIMYAHDIVPNADGSPHRTTVHEQFHVKQFESVTLGSFVWSWIPFIFLMTTGHPPHAVACMLLMWFTGTLQHSVGGWLTAWIRGERAYRDSYHEQSAYAVDYKYQQTGLRIT